MVARSVKTVINVPLTGIVNKLWKTNQTMKS